LELHLCIEFEKHNIERITFDGWAKHIYQASNKSNSCFLQIRQQKETLEKIANNHNCLDIDYKLKYSNATESLNYCEKEKMLGIHETNKWRKETFPG